VGSSFIFAALKVPREKSVHEGSLITNDGYIPCQLQEVEQVKAIQANMSDFAASTSEQPGS
jgi:hypothetical protein